LKPRPHVSGLAGKFGLRAIADPMHEFSFQKTHEPVLLAKPGRSIGNFFVDTLQVKR
tara:strand:- start:245 stop:415 length:171 start_codon:yes stop_codon:yes gene_type:complete